MDTKKGRNVCMRKENVCVCVRIEMYVCVKRMYVCENRNACMCKENVCVCKENVCV